MCDLGESGGFGAERLPVIFVDFVVIAHARAGKADELPADHAGVAAVNGIAKHALDGVLAEECEKDRGLDLLQGFVLLAR